MKNITKIRSPHFTKILPKRTKFKLEEQVRLIKLTQYNNLTHPALERYGAGQVGKVVGMNYKKGNYMRCYPYYVEFPDGYVFPIKSAYLEPEDTVLAKRIERRNSNRRHLRRLVEGVVRDVLKNHGDHGLNIGDYSFTDGAVTKICALYE